MGKLPSHAVVIPMSPAEEGGASGPDTVSASHQARVDISSRDRSASTVPSPLRPVRGSDSLRVDDVPPPNLTWCTQFADPKEERAYFRVEMGPLLAKRMIIVGSSLFVATGSLVLALDHNVEQGGAGHIAALVGASLWAPMALLGLWLRKSGHNARVLELNVLCTVLLCVEAFISSVAFKPARVAAVFGRQHVMPSAGRTTSEEAMLLQLLMPCIAGIFLPLFPASFGLVAALIIALNVTLDQVTSAACEDASCVSGGSFARTATLVLVLGTLFLCRIHMHRSFRVMYHFRETVRQALARAEEEAEERRAAEAETAAERERNLTAEAAKAARSRLIRMVMHDLRSPLLSVSNIAATLSQMLGKPDGGREGAPTNAAAQRPPPVNVAAMIEAVRPNVDALGVCSALMEGIVSDMLDFERIDSGRLVLVPQPFTLKRLLADVRATFDGLAAQRGIDLRFPPLPPELCKTERADEPCFEGDARRLLQALNNGVSNAIKFTERGGHVEVRAWLGPPGGGSAQRLRSHASVARVLSQESPTRAGSVGALQSAAPAASAAAESAPADKRPLAEVHILVEDSGVGLTADELRVLNEGTPFAQVGRGQLQGNGGSGLGLNITRELLRLHNGSSLSLASDGPHTGSRFEMVLRLLRVALSAARVDADTLAQSRRVGTLRASTVEASVEAEKQAAEAAARRSTASASRRSTADLPPADDVGSPPRVRSDVRALFVEDDAFLRMTFPVRTFDALGIPYDEAHDGIEAVQAVRTALAAGTPPAVIVLDNQMPRMGGAQAAREIRALGYRGMIIGMTGDPAGCVERLEFEAAGLDDCLDKDGHGVAEIIEKLRDLASTPTKASKSW